MAEEKLTRSQGIVDGEVVELAENDYYIDGEVVTLAENQVYVNGKIVTISDEERMGNTSVIGDNLQVGDPIVITDSNDVVSAIGHFGGWGVDVKKKEEGYDLSYYSGVVFCSENMYMGYGVSGQKVYKTAELVVAEMPYQKWIYNTNGLQPNPDYKEPTPEETIPPQTLELLEQRWMDNLVKEVATEEVSK